MRRALLLLCLYLLIGPTPLAHTATPRWNDSQGMTATRLPIGPSNVRATLAPGIQLAEAWWLRSDHSGFGAFSAMTLIGPRRFILAADSGMLAGLTIDRRGRIDRPFIAPFPGGPGRGTFKADRDLEAMTMDPVSGRIWTAYEHSHQIWRFARALSRPDGHVRPAAMATWNKNGGAEAMVRLADGRFLVMSESTEVGARGTAALIFPGDPTEAETGPPLRFTYDSGTMGRVTDAAQLPDGRVLLLHRRLSLTDGFVSTIAIASLSRVRSGSTWSARQIARFAAPGISENFEGIAVENDGGRISLWMVSDDNLMRWQRSLLLRLSLSAPLLADGPHRDGLHTDATNPGVPAQPGFVAMP